MEQKQELTLEEMDKVAEKYGVPLRDRYQIDY